MTDLLDEFACRSIYGRDALLAAAAVLPVAYVDNTALAIVLLSVGYFASQVPIGCLWTLASDIAGGTEAVGSAMDA